MPFSIACACRLQGVSAHICGSGDSFGEAEDVRNDQAATAVKSTVVRVHAMPPVCTH